MTWIIDLNAWPSEHYSKQETAMISIGKQGFYQAAFQANLCAKLHRFNQWKEAIVRKAEIRNKYRGSRDFVSSDWIFGTKVCQSKL